MAEAQTSITSKEGLSNEKVYVIKSGRTKNSNGKTPPYYVLYNEASSEYLSSTYGAGPATAFDQNSSIFQFSIYKYVLPSLFRVVIINILNKFFF